MEQHQRLLAMDEHAAAAGEARQALATARERRGAEALAIAELSSENQALTSGNQALSREVQALQGVLGDVRARGEAGEATLRAELQRVLSGQGAVVAGLQEENGRLRELAQSAHEVGAAVEGEVSGPGLVRE